MAQKINCRWQKSERLLVNPDGQVFPCCYLANFYYLAKTLYNTGNADKVFQGHNAQMTHPLMQQYMNNEATLNVFNNSVEEIVNSEWFTETLPKSWESEDTVHIQCKRVCSVE